MKMNHYTLIITLLSFIFIGCGTNRYVVHAPDTPVVPFFKEKGDMKVSAGAVWNGNSNKAGLTTQAAYAITNNWAATISYNSQNEKEKRDVDWSYILPSRSDDIGRYYKRKNVSIGGGYYKVVGDKQNKSLNLYGGVGFGNVEVTENVVYTNSQTQQQYRRNVSHRNKLTRYYIHPSYSIMPGKVFRGNFGARFTLANFHSFTSNLPKEELDQRNWPMTSKTFVYLEPSVNLQVAVVPKVMAFDIGVTFSLHLKQPERTKILTSDNYRENHMDANRGMLFYTRFTFALEK